MANFWDSASQGFNRGVGFGADAYNRALDRARQAKLDAQAERQQAAAEKHRAQVLALSREQAERQAKLQAVQVARQQFLMGQEKAEAKRLDEPLPQSVLDAYGKAGTPLAPGTTLRELEAMGGALDFQQKAALKRIPTRHENLNSGGGGGANELFPAQDVASLEAYDDVLADLDGQIETLAGQFGGDPVELRALRTRRSVVAAQRAGALRQTDPRAYQLYGQEETPRDELGPYLPALDAIRNAGRDQVDSVRLLPGQSPVAPTQEDPLNFLDDIDLGGEPEPEPDSIIIGQQYRQ